MWSFKETRETRKELISKGGGEGSCLRKRAKLERNLYPREGGGGSCFTKRAKLERNLYPRWGEGSPHWLHFYFKVYRVPRRSFLTGMITESFCR